jgi:hypothetical protein
MVGRGHNKETAGLLNVNSIHLNTLFDGMSWLYQRNRGVEQLHGVFGMTTIYHRKWCLNI